jgi:hypothetical protein
VKCNTAQAHAFSVAFILEVQRRQEIIVDPASIQFGDPALGPAYEALLFLCVFLVSIMRCSRGNEAYLLELAKCKMMPFSTMRLDSGSAASITSLTFWAQRLLRQGSCVCLV